MENGIFGLLDQDIPHILVVDDQEMNRLVLSRVLHEFNITEASNGVEALELIDTYSFDVVLLDIMMVGMNGLEVLQTIRQQFDSTELPVILISALSDQKDIVHGLRIGANDYVAKPIDVVVVKARVEAQVHVKRAFDVQKQAYHELKQANLLKNRLLSIASHDLKAPVSNIYMAETLLRQIMANDDPMVTTILDTMKMTLDNMNHIIVEFLDMAALQSGSITVDMQAVDLQKVIIDVIDHYAFNSEEKGSMLIPPEGNGIVYADPVRLRQVLSNLVSNALKYSPPNSEIRINVIKHDDQFVIEVKDQGLGIPDDERDLLFTEFGKLSTRPTGDESSTGLGLWIVKQMVEMMGGQVGVRCPETGGSIFWVELPASSAISS